jgi:cytochrome P450
LQQKVLEMRRLSDENIRYQMVTFLIAGHETTSGLLSFTIYELLRHPEVMARAREEVERVLGNETPRFEHLQQLTYRDRRNGAWLCAVDWPARQGGGATAQRRRGHHRDGLL